MMIQCRLDKVIENTMEVATASSDAQHTHERVEERLGENSNSVRVPCIKPKISPSTQPANERTVDEIIQMHVCCI